MVKLHDVMLIIIAISALFGASSVLKRKEPAPYVDQYDRWEMRLNRSEAERVVDILIASGNYSDLPDIFELEDGRVQICAMRGE